MSALFSVILAFFAVALGFGQGEQDMPPRCVTGQYCLVQNAIYLGSGTYLADGMGAYCSLPGHQPSAVPLAATGQMAFSFAAPATDFNLGGFSYLSSPTPGGAIGCGWFGLDRIQIVVSKEYSAENNLLYGVWKGIPTNWILEDHEESTYDRMREVIVYDADGVGIRFLATFDSQTDQYTYALPSSGSTGAATGSRAILLHYPQAEPNHVLYGGPPGAMGSQGAWNYGFHLTDTGDGAKALLSSIKDPIGNLVIFGLDQGYRLVTPQLIGAEYRIDIDGGGVEYRNSHRSTNWISLGSAPSPDADCEGSEGVFGWNGRQGQTNEPYWIELENGSSSGSNYTLITEGSGSSTSQVQQKWVWEAAKDVEKQLYGFAYGWTTGQQDTLQRLKTFYLGEIPTSYQYQYDAVDVNGWTVNRGFKVTIKPGVSNPASSTPRAAELFFDYGPASQQPLGEFKTLRVKRPKLNEESGNDLTVHSFQGGTAAFSQVSYYSDAEDDPEEYRWRRTTYFQFTDLSAPTKIALSPDSSTTSDPREITFDYDAYVDQNWPSGVFETRLTGVTDPAGNEIVINYGENHGDGPTGSKANPPLLPSSIELVAAEGPDPRWRFDYTWSTSGTLTTPNGLLRGFSEPDRGWWELIYDDENGDYPFKLRQVVDPTDRAAAVDAYDELGRPTLVKLFPSGTSGTPLWSETEYTLLGQPAEATTGFGSSAHSTTKFAWSGQFLTGVTDPRGHVASFYYNTQTALGKTGMLGQIAIGTGQDEKLYANIVRDELGRPWKIEGGNGVYVEYAYGHRDELLSTYCSGDPTTDKELFHYACCGLLEKWTRPDGQYVHFTYDGFGALSQVRFNAETGDADEGFLYDSAGRLENASNIAGASAFAYGEFGRLATETVESRDPSDGSAVATILFESEYYPSGDLKKTIMKQGTTVISTLEYVYDEAGRLETIKNGGSAFASYAYDGAGRLTAADAIIGTGATLYGTASYADSQLAGSLGSLGYKINTASPFASFGYAYYADGALAEAADTVGSTSRSYEWDYNPDGSLQYETIGGATTAFEYDAGGNLTAWGASTGWQYSHNRLTEVPSKGYEFYYTDNGERAAWFQTPTMPDGAG
ncbi:MAG: RHS repeat protein, partial [Armatimonadetes bacterium]|nr:RHS repeat protein [Armatimonadota bacterium]